MPGVNRVLYLDEDTICTGSLWKLYNEDMKGRPYMGFMDACIVNYYPFMPDFTLTHNRNYVNSGVILIDVNYDIYPELDNYIKNAIKWNRLHIPYMHDQTLINMFHPNVFECSKQKRRFHFTYEDYYAQLIISIEKTYNIIHYWRHKRVRKRFFNNRWDDVIYKIIDTA